MSESNASSPDRKNSKDRIHHLKSTIQAATTSTTTAATTTTSKNGMVSTKNIASPVGKIITTSAATTAETTPLSNNPKDSSSIRDNDVEPNNKHEVSLSSTKSIPSSELDALTKSSTSINPKDAINKKLLSILWDQYQAGRVVGEQQQQQPNEQQQNSVTNRISNENDDDIITTKNGSTNPTKLNTMNGAVGANKYKQNNTDFVEKTIESKPKDSSIRNLYVSSLSNQLLKKSTINNYDSSTNASSSGTNNNNNTLDSVLQIIQQQVPVKDVDELHSKWIYKGAVQLLHWQRDNYFIGTQYANQRKIQRSADHLLLTSDGTNTTAGSSTSIMQQQQQYIQLLDELAVPNNSSNNNDNSKLVYNSLGQTQITRLIGDFIPTATVQKATVPLVGQVPDLLYSNLIVPSIVNHVIYAQQDNLNTTIKNNLIRFLRNPTNRTAIKNSMIQAIPPMVDTTTTPISAVGGGGVVGGVGTTDASTTSTDDSSDRNQTSITPSDTKDDATIRTKVSIPPERKWRIPHVPSPEDDDDAWSDDGYR